MATTSDPMLDYLHNIHMNTLITKPKIQPTKCLFWTRLDDLVYLAVVFVVDVFDKCLLNSHWNLTIEEG